MERSAEQKMMKLNRGNHGTFTILYRYRAISHQWADLLENEEPTTRGEESAEQLEARTAACMYDLLSSISPGILARVQSGAATPYQWWQNINNFGSECKQIRETMIRKTLYNLTLHDAASFDWWSTKVYKFFEELSALTGMDLSDSEKISILLINLGKSFAQIRQGLSTSQDMTFEAAMETLRSECLTSQAAQGNGERNSFRDSHQQQQHQQQQPFQQQRNPHGNFQRQHQRNHQANVSTAFWPRPCHECGSIEHLARNCPVRLTRPRSFCRVCNRVVFHTTEEHAGRNVNNIQDQTARNQRRGLIVIGANNTENISNNDSAYFESSDSVSESISEPYFIQVSVTTIRHRNRNRRNNRYPRPVQINTILDSGATAHIFSQKRYFQKISKQNKYGGISVGNGNTISALGIGQVHLNECVSIQDVIFSPGMKLNVLSVSQFIKDGCKVNFHTTGASVYYQNQEVLKFRLQDGLYHLKSGPPTYKSYFLGINQNRSGSIGTYQLWHKRLAHINKSYIDRLSNKSLATGIPRIVTNNIEHQCRECSLSKSKKKPTGRVQGDPILFKPGEYLSADLVTMHVRTMHSEKYALTIVDEGSGTIYSFLLRHKDEASKLIQEHILFLQKQIKREVVHFKADGKGEFVNDYLKEWFRSKGIAFNVGPPYTPEYNSKK